MKIRVLTLVVVLALLVITFTGGIAALGKKQTIRFGYVNWPGVTVKTWVARNILETLGYEVTMDQLLVPALYKGLSIGELDGFVGGWIPTMLKYLEPYFEEGTIEKAVVNLNETVYTLAVPKYVWDAGVHSEADLHKYEEKFDLDGNGKPEIYGIEPGNEGNLIMIEAIENNTYNLKNWELIASSTAGMLSQVKKAVPNGDWIVWLGWKPHWMNMAWDIKYLKDPLELWGPPGAEVVWTITRKGFAKDVPNVARFLEQFKVTPAWQSDWIYNYTYAGNEPNDVAEKWIREHLDVVDLWVYGVKSVDGKRARDVIRAKFGQ